MGIQVAGFPGFRCQLCGLNKSGIGDSYPNTRIPGYPISEKVRGPLAEITTMLQAENIHKTYKRHAVEVRVLNGLNLEVKTGEFLSVVGVSGSGKSTLLHLLGTLDAPDSGSILLDGKRIDNLPARERDTLRNNTFGYIFQFYHLLPELSTLDNVLMPAYIGHSVLGWWKSRGQWRARAEELLRKVGLGHRLKHRPRELSGGEMQRAAVARRS